MSTTKTQTKKNNTRNYINKSLWLAPSVKRNLLKTYNNLPNSNKNRFNIKFIKDIEKMHRNKLNEALKEKREKNKLKEQKMLKNFMKGMKKNK